MQSCTVLMYPHTERLVLHFWGVPTPPRNLLPRRLLPPRKQRLGLPGKPNQRLGLHLGISHPKLPFGFRRDPLRQRLQFPMLMLLPLRRPPHLLSEVPSALSR